MFKKSVIAVLFSLMIAMVLGTSTFAQTNIQTVKYDSEEVTPEIAKALAEVEKTNAKIFVEIEKTVIKYEKLYNRYNKDLIKHQNSSKQAKLTADYKKQSDKLISQLKVKTERMTIKGIEKAEKAGLIVEIYLETVEFSDRTELIDPILVVGW
ncbi:hypothetical protein ACQKDD_05210 [Planococcus kocurii]|uniref:OmpH family outer membrane protein n=1 Tax=Planococcus kocurii TaxID=1374 RepID=A0ABM5WTE3_9BACL|nr:MULTISPECIES: hypothetical protein [Planococcus]ALS77514.1 hypothetical protein AUO94_02140 [Planococcus kocurii]KAA0959103.1 hypothetical protein FQ085_05120 [Planococcus sp. ANT_H30]